MDLRGRARSADECYVFVDFHDSCFIARMLAPHESADAREPSDCHRVPIATRGSASRTVINSGI